MENIFYLIFGELISAFISGPPEKVIALLLDLFLKLLGFFRAVQMLWQTLKRFDLDQVLGKLFEKFRKLWIPSDLLLSSSESSLKRIANFVGFPGKSGFSVKKLQSFIDLRVPGLFAALKQYFEFEG